MYADQYVRRTMCNQLHAYKVLTLGDFFELVRQVFAVKVSVACEYHLEEHPVKVVI